MTAPHLTLGSHGEDLAAHTLRTAGLVILDRNWRCRHGELDIIATDGHHLVFVEVKTRTATTHGTPAESVTGRKATRIRLLADRWRVDHGVHPCDMRFDIISIIAPPDGTPIVRHLKAAF